MMIAGVKATAETCVSAPSSSSTAASSSASAGSGVPEVAPASGGAGLGAGDPTNGHKARIIKYFSEKHQLCTSLVSYYSGYIVI